MSELKVPTIVFTVLMVLMFFGMQGYYRDAEIFKKLTQVPQAQASEKLPGVIEELASNGTCTVYKTHIPNTENNIFVTCINGTTKLQ